MFFMFLQRSFIEHRIKNAIKLCFRWRRKETENENILLLIIDYVRVCVWCVAYVSSGRSQATKMNNSNAHCTDQWCISNRTEGTECSRFRHFGPSESHKFDSKGLVKQNDIAHYWHRRFFFFFFCLLLLYLSIDEAINVCGRRCFPFCSRFFFFAILLRPGT